MKINQVLLMILVVAISFTGFSQTTIDLEQNSETMISEDIITNVVLGIADSEAYAVVTPYVVNAVITNDYLYSSATITPHEEYAVVLSLNDNLKMDNKKQFKRAKIKNQSKSKFWTNPIDNYYRTPRDGLSCN